MSLKHSSYYSTQLTWTALEHHTPPVCKTQDSWFQNDTQDRKDTKDTLWPRKAMVIHKNTWNKYLMLSYRGLVRGKKKNRERKVCKWRNKRWNKMFRSTSWHVYFSSYRDLTRRVIYRLVKPQCPLTGSIIKKNHKNWQAFYKSRANPMVLVEKRSRSAGTWSTGLFPPPFVDEFP